MFLKFCTLLITVLHIVVIKFCTLLITVLHIIVNGSLVTDACKEGRPHGRSGLEAASRRPRTNFTQLECTRRCHPVTFRATLSAQHRFCTVSPTVCELAASERAGDVQTGGRSMVGEVYPGGGTPGVLGRAPRPHHAQDPFLQAFLSTLLWGKCPRFPEWPESPKNRKDIPGFAKPVMADLRK